MFSFKSLKEQWNANFQKKKKKRKRKGKNRWEKLLKLFKL